MRRECEPFPWDDATAFALGVLRWSPREFWMATPRELIAAHDGVCPGRREPAAGRSDLARMMARYPDRSEG